MLSASAASSLWLAFFTSGIPISVAEKVTQPRVSNFALMVNFISSDSPSEAARDASNQPTSSTSATSKTLTPVSFSVNIEEGSGRDARRKRHDRVA
ncbi:hypothetical protein CLU85_0585 [Acidovorax sp. 69]|nr:hypothetical protein CLU85_0585 [Acidovorax sp. 69]